MICKICKSKKIKDLTGGLGTSRNYYCIDCKAHWYDGKWYTKEEWEKWINEEDNLHKK